MCQNRWQLEDQLLTLEWNGKCWSNYYLLIFNQGNYHNRWAIVERQPFIVCSDEETQGCKLLAVNIRPVVTLRYQLGRMAIFVSVQNILISFFFFFSKPCFVYNKFKIVIGSVNPNEVTTQLTYPDAAPKFIHWSERTGMITKLNWNPQPCHPLFLSTNVSIEIKAFPL